MQQLILSLVDIVSNHGRLGISVKCFWNTNAYLKMMTLSIKVEGKSEKLSSSKTRGILLGKTTKKQAKP